MYRYLFNSDIEVEGPLDLDQPNLFGYNLYATFRWGKKRYFAVLHSEESDGSDIQIYLATTGTDDIQVTYSNGIVMTTLNKEIVQTSSIYFTKSSSLDERYDLLFIYMISTIERFTTENEA